MFGALPTFVRFGLDLVYCLLVALAFVAPAIEAGWLTGLAFVVVAAVGFVTEFVCDRWLFEPFASLDLDHTIQTLRYC